MGNWKATKATVYEADTGYLVADCRDSSHPVAFARLIAASPALYEALEALLEATIANVDSLERLHERTALGTHAAIKLGMDALKAAIDAVEDGAEDTGHCDACGKLSDDLSGAINTICTDGQFCPACLGLNQ